MEKQLPLFTPPASPRHVECHLGIPGLSYRRGFLDEGEQEGLLREIDAHPWFPNYQRSSQHYGRLLYDQAQRIGAPKQQAAPFPPFAQELARRLVEAGLCAEIPDQVSVNQYLPGQGIGAHIDRDSYLDRVTIVSLGWEYEMDFINVADSKVRRTCLLELGSVLVMEGEARYQWMHGIRGRLADRGVPRGRRVSVTFRHARMGANRFSKGLLWSTRPT